MRTRTVAGLVVVHMFKMTSLIVLITGCIFLPYLPGPYDALAVTLSAMASTASIAGLLLVPIGALWLILEFRKPPPAGEGSSPQHNWYAFASMAVALLIGALMSVIALASMGPSLACGTMALWVYAVSRTLARLKRPKQFGLPRFNPTPLYLILVPTTVVLLQWALAGPATEFSRSRAIANSAQFIHDIEQYHRAYGHYPRSLLAEWKDYRPMVIGISEFHYEPNGESYNVFFEQPTFRFGTREFVMYNTRNEHVLASHNSDRLLWTVEQQAARPGYYAAHDASIPHWKYFWFD